MSDPALPPCPQCGSAYAYADGRQLVCPECAHEWPRQQANAAEEIRVIRDANGNQLQNGDSVTVGAPLVEGALVAAHFVATEKQRTVIIQKKHRRQHFEPGKR